MLISNFQKMSNQKLPSWRDIFMVNPAPKNDTIPIQKADSSSIIGPQTSTVSSMTNVSQNQEPPKFMTPQMRPSMDSEKFGSFEDIMNYYIN